MKKIIVGLILLFSVKSFAQTAALPLQSCVQGGVQAKTSGILSSNYLQGVVPYCTVKVYLTGTTTLATIFKDANSTPQTNPFTATVSGSFLIYAAINQGYDVVLSGGYSPNTYATPVTKTGLYPSSNITIPSQGCTGANTIANGCTGATTKQGAATAIVDGSAINPSSVGQTGTPGPANFSTVAAGTTNPVTIGGATGSCTGLYAKADGTGCGNPGGGGSSGIAPSGDTTGSTDTAAINAAITAGNVVTLNAGQFYVTGPIIISKPVSIIGAGSGQTILNLTSSTANLFTESYGGTLGFNSNVSAGAIQRGFTVKMKSGVTATAGDVFSLSGNASASQFMTGLHIEDVHMIDVAGCFRLGAWMISDWIQNNYCITSVTGGDGFMVYDVPSPGGDIHIDNNEAAGLNVNLKLVEADTTEITNQKLNGGEILFGMGSGQTVSRVRIVNPSIEGLAGGAACGIDFGTNGTARDIQIIGGGIGLQANALCHTASVYFSSLYYSFLDYSTSRTYDTYVESGAAISNIMAAGIAIPQIPAGSGGVFGIPPFPSINVAQSGIVLGAQGGGINTYGDIYWICSICATNKQVWDLQNSGNQFVGRFINSALTTTANWLEVSTDGTAITGIQFRATGMATTGTFSASGSISGAAGTFTGLLTATAGSILQGTLPTPSGVTTSGIWCGINSGPECVQINSGAATDGKAWYTRYGTTDLIFSTLTDALGSGVNWLDVNRTGQTINTAYFPEQLVSNTLRTGITATPPAVTGANQIGMGGTTLTTSNCNQSGTLTKVVACIQANYWNGTASTTAYIPVMVP